MPDAALNPSTPNILLICCDHLRSDWLGCNGHPIVQTPQIDKLAYQGVSFRQAFSECPVCVPARRILFTGMGPFGVHMRENVDLQPFPEGPKLAEVMTRSGYQTFASGKLHVFPQRNRIGFEDVALNEEGRRQDSPEFVDDYEAFVNDSGYAHLAYTHGLGNNQYGLRLSPLPERLTTTHWTAQQAMRFVERRDPTRPFFLYVSFDKPHPPITPPTEFYELYRDVVMPEPAFGPWARDKVPGSVRHLRLANNQRVNEQMPPATVQQSLRGYAAMVTHIDSMVGVILGTLREHGLLDNTHVLFTSDHGDHLFEHGNLAKSDFFRGSTNIPYIVRPARTWAQRNGFRPDRVDAERAVGLADVMPTVLELCGLPIPPSVEGISLAPALVDGGAPFRPYTFGVCGSAYGVSDGHFKYIWFGDDDLEFLFDQHTDPDELHDLVDVTDHAERLATYRAALTEWLAANGDPHAREGRLVPTPHNRHEDQGRSPNIWNNRGRH
jgi:arylsulfatase